ncbi:hypothetical protein GCM10010211_13180 [Streptomyces albospinus]|uniref:Uncharacterized protein n=1 Tax=Streptomyces albospinus TaxID=285515 RepID=A0ABQ2URL2_9ACTN|nr:hypothetical protein GCM10010211_13180 [Streptomyces albospinus]
MRGGEFENQRAADSGGGDGDGEGIGHLGGPAHGVLLCSGEGRAGTSPVTLIIKNGTRSDHPAGQLPRDRAGEGGAYCAAGRPFPVWIPQTSEGVLKVRFG